MFELQKQEIKSQSYTIIPILYRVFQKARAISRGETPQIRIRFIFYINISPILLYFVATVLIFFRYIIIFLKVLLAIRMKL